MKLLQGMIDRSTERIKLIPKVVIMAHKPSNLKDSGVQTVVPHLRVRSKEESMIVQALAELKVRFEYERWKIVVQYGKDDRIHSKKSFLVPDFYLPDYNLFIEHFGMYNKSNPDYFEEAQRKVQMYIDSKVRFIYTLPEELYNGLGHLKALISKKISESR